MAHNQEEFYDQFKQISVLTADTTDLINRLNNRWGQTIGKAPSELRDILMKHEGFEQHLLNSGAVRIDVTKPVKEVVDQILSHISKVGS